jgi:type IV pilus assembly protein PilC
LPVIGPLNRKAAISRFARTLGTLVASGVPILESLEIVRDVVGNEVISRVVKGARDAVENGEKLVEPLRVSQEFPQDAVQMIAIGEETGDLDSMLNKISDFYDMYIGYSVKKLTSLIEPLFLVVLGGLVAFIMASMLLPIFDMIKILRR